ncbi:hypothetical protein F4818DRAFT_442547 [Hypoxylon cercidicola]|nr:hypothetical protein F4818DRAFT_442547 [Hypoxylon cercidicola]
MSLCKALRSNSARPSRHRTISPAHFNRRCFADRHSNPSKPHTIQDNPSSDEQLSSVRDDVFKINPENKTVETAVGELPLSPVMDPTFWEATRRHQVLKAKPGKPQNSVERQLRANAFAKALATPVRMCAMSRARLPSFFLQDFNLIAHPETGAPWLIPPSLMSDKPSRAQKSETKGTARAVNEASSDETKEGVEDPKAAESTKDGQLRGPAAHVLARQDLLSSFVIKWSGFDNAPKQITAMSLKQKSLAGKVVWRKDMDTYILDLMRQAIVDDMLYLSRLCSEEGRHYIVKCYGWGDVQHKHKGAVLWFGEPEEGAGSDQASNEPGPFATFDIQKEDIQGETMTTSVAVHNVPMLLGSEQAERIRKEAAALKDGSIFMLAGRRTADLQMKLWKLQGYIADYREI